MSRPEKPAGSASADATGRRIETDQIIQYARGADNPIRAETLSHAVFYKHP